LPYPGKGDPIHLDLIDLIWLDEHPESASRRMILHWTKLEAEEGELADAEDEGMDGGDWAQVKDDDIDPKLRSDHGDDDSDTKGLYAP